MNAGRTARDRARAELTAEIKAAARRQLATEGAERLSLRAIARELGMVSSALYRYFPSRDDLLTALIIDAYDALGTRAEAAAGRAPDPLDAWKDSCRAIRTWAQENPHEYALIYGSPVPGYQAPQTTIQPATRAAAVLLGVLSRAYAEGRLVPPEDAPEPGGVLVEQLRRVEELAPGVPPKVLLRTMIVWTQLFGAISFELFGQLVGTMDPADAFFEETLSQQTAFLGLH